MTVAPPEEKNISSSHGEFAIQNAGGLPITAQSAQQE
jgi:hypothetical protein